MIQHKLYLYKNFIDLLISNDKICVAKDNAPMNNYKIKLHKGIDNKIDFRVYDRDRKEQNVSNLVVRALICDKITKERIIDKFCDAGYSKGSLVLNIREGEIADVAPGFYKLIVTSETELVYGQEGDVIGNAFYTNHNSDIEIEVEITETATILPEPTFEITTWTPQRLIQNSKLISYYTAAVPCSRVKNHIDPLHTVAMYLKNYSGKIQVLATLEHTPPQDLKEWFPIDITSLDNFINIENTTGIFHFTFKSQFMWIRILHTPKDGTDGVIEKVLIRN